MNRIFLKRILSTDNIIGILSSKTLPLILMGVVFFLTLPSLFTGLQFDDYFVIQPSFQCWASAVGNDDQRGRPSPEGFSYTSDANDLEKSIDLREERG